MQQTTGNGTACSRNNSSSAERAGRRSPLHYHWFLKSSDFTAISRGSLCDCVFARISRRLGARLRARWGWGQLCGVEKNLNVSVLAWEAHTYSLSLSVARALARSLAIAPSPYPSSPTSPPPPLTFCWVAISSRGPGQSPVLPFACCVGSLRSVGHCGLCSCWCRFRVSENDPLPPPSLCVRVCVCVCVCVGSFQD